MDRILTYTIKPEQEGMQLLDFLRSKGFSRGILSSMKADKNAIQLNGERGFGKSILQAGDSLHIHIPEADNTENILPVKMDLSILYEDEDILVINKAADMPVHPSIGNYDNTLANGVTWYFKEKGQQFVYRCINRLDRDTTGALILAKNPYSAAVLSAQMKQRQIRRTYLALTDGIPPEKGTVSAPIARMDDSVITREVNWEHGETAVTHYERLAVSNGYSLVELHLDTGRTHQIRAHLASEGHPLAGDTKYGQESFNRRCREKYQLKHQLLHAFRLSFPDGMDGRLSNLSGKCFQAALPAQFQRIIKEEKLEEKLL